MAETYKIQSLIGRVGISGIGWLSILGFLASSLFWLLINFHFLNRSWRNNASQCEAWELWCPRTIIKPHEEFIQKFHPDANFLLKERHVQHILRAMREFFFRRKYEVQTIAISWRSDSLILSPDPASHASMCWMLLDRWELLIKVNNQLIASGGEADYPPVF